MKTQNLIQTTNSLAAMEKAPNYFVLYHPFHGKFSWMSESSRMLLQTTNTQFTFSAPITWSSVFQTEEPEWESLILPKDILTRLTDDPENLLFRLTISPYASSAIVEGVIIEIKAESDNEDLQNRVTRLSLKNLNIQKRLNKFIARIESDLEVPRSTGQAIGTLYAGISALDEQHQRKIMEVTDYLNIIQGDITRTFLELNRILKSNQSWFDLNETIDNVLLKFSDDVVAGKFRINVKELPMIYGDEESVAYMFHLLLDLIIHSEHDKNSEPTISIGTTHISNKVLISIRDHSYRWVPKDLIGIQDKISSTFLPEHSVYHFCDQIMEAHNGDFKTIGVITGGKSSVFRFDAEHTRIK